MLAPVDLILNDTWEQLQRALRLLPDGAVRQRLEEMVVEGYDHLRHKARSLKERHGPDAESAAAKKTEGAAPWSRPVDEGVAALLERQPGAAEVLRGAMRILSRAERMVVAVMEDSPEAKAVTARLTAHRTVYNSPFLPPFECNMITPRLLAGRNPLTERDVEWLEDMGVTHVLDLREEAEWRSPWFGAEAVRRLGDRRRSLPITDMTAPSPEVLDEAFRYLTEVLTLPDSMVYVHCRAGMQRTASILTAFWARSHGLSYDEALAALRERRPVFDPLPSQEQAVRRWLSSHG